MKIITWNVNGMRSWIKKGLLPWWQKERPDILCLQETRATPEQLDQSLLFPQEYFSHFSSAQKKGYSGVAIFTHKNLLQPKLIANYENSILEQDNEGRSLILEFPHFILVNVYIPNGQRDHARVPYKMDYCRSLTDTLNQLRHKKKKGIIVTGDFNIAHHPIDLKNPLSNSLTTGFLPVERKWLSEFIDHGYRDIFREHHPGEEGHYTWWSQRSQCREKNIGWRLDYFFVTEELIPKVKKINHAPQILGSDHCPVLLELNTL